MVFFCGIIVFPWSLRSHDAISRALNILSQKRPPHPCSFIDHRSYASSILHPTSTSLPMADGKLNIIVFPWLAFGHMMPFLELSKFLAKRGHHISYLSTRRNIDRLPKIPPHLSPLIDFIPLSLPPIPGLPATAEATSDLPPHLVEYLKKALDDLEPAFLDFMEKSTPKPDWIIMDFAQHWLPKIANDYHVPTLFFSVYNAATLSSMRFRCSTAAVEPTAEELTGLPPWVPFPSSVVLRLHEARALLGAYRSNASGVNDAYRMAMAMEATTAVAPRSCRELESEYLCLLQELYQKPVVPTGLLPAQAGRQEDYAIMDWLDKQDPRSVVYVAFGSEARLGDEMVSELAMGLEISGIPFLWALRESADFLPEGFEERTRGRGVVAMGWVPQPKVLAHGSVGGFLTHVGWSSAIESLQFGIPVVLLPICLDQGLNSRLLKAKKMGVEIERDEEDGRFEREAVARALKLVMLNEDGEAFRAKAGEMRKIFGEEGCHEKYLDDFVQYLCDYKK